MITPALLVENLSVTYANGHRALDGVSLTIEAEGSLSIVGPSGCGKTTMLRAVLGLLPPGTVVTGRIEIDGHDVLTASPAALRELHGRSVGYVSQDPYAACDPLRRVRHHVAEAWVAVGEPAPSERIDAGLTRIGIPDPPRQSRQWPHQWSGGMLQRATTLAATVHDPSLTLADEPTSALDTDLADETLELLRSTSSALLLVTHDLALAVRHTDQVVVFYEGHLVERGHPKALLSVPQHKITQKLVAAACPTARLHPKSPSQGAVVIETNSITKTYTHKRHSVTAVRSTSISVLSGEVLGLVGPSGSGKSTLLRLLAGMEKPDSGTLLAQGERVWGAGHGPRMPRKGFAMPVFQDPVASLDPRWPLWRTITEPLVLAGIKLDRHSRRALATHELFRVGMGDVGIDRLPGTLSVGQCQRVAIVRALISKPALLAADEPTASLDVEASAGISTMLREAADQGTAVVVVSHDENRLRSYADKVLRVRDGSVTHDD